MTVVQNGYVQRESIDGCKDGQDSEVNLAKCLLPESCVPVRGLFVEDTGFAVGHFQLIFGTLLFERAGVHGEREAQRVEGGRRVRGCDCGGQRPRGSEIEHGFDLLRESQDSSWVEAKRITDQG
jgi:hypothetical protein